MFRPLLEMLADSPLVFVAFIISIKVYLTTDLDYSIQVYLKKWPVSVCTYVIAHKKCHVFAFMLM